RRRHTRSKRDWSSDVCSSDLADVVERVTPGPPSGLIRPINVLRKTDLPVPEGAEHRADLTRRDRQRDVTPDELLAERLGQVVDRSEERRVGKERGARWHADRQ